MEFKIEFYETASGKCPVKDFLEELKRSDIGDFTDERLQASHGTDAGLAGKEPEMKQKTNFDRYLEEQLKDKEFADRFKKAGEAWDVAIQLSALRNEAGLSQKELARRAGTSQQQISRLESPSYEGHSLSMLRRVAEVLGASLHVEFQRRKRSKHLGVAEERKSYAVKKRKPQPIASQ
jgi:transcriptional regulator with XRE-family HTH domain